MLTFVFKVLISVKYIFWQIFKEIVDNQDFYRRKDDLVTDRLTYRDRLTYSQSNS